MKQVWSTILVILIWCGSTALVQGADFPRSSLRILSQDGRVAVFQVEIASTPDQHALGLMHRTGLAQDAGMLFDFHQPQIIRMWMKNTLIPLDMLFIGADGRIRTIAARTVPHSTAVISSQTEVLAVLEVAGGTASRLNLVPGDLVDHPIFSARK